jgi:two-component system nitrate/nitrite response regulator NarL
VSGPGRIIAEVVVRIVLCDDHRLLLEALSITLSLQGFTVQAATPEPKQAVEAVRQLDPDLLLMDLGFNEGSDGLIAVREVRRSNPRTRVVIFTGSSDPAPMLEAVKMGVSGVVRKDNRIDNIVTTLRRAAAGESTFDERTLMRMIGAGQPTQAPRAPIDNLTGQERVVLQSLADGKSTSEIVGQLSISQSTVRSHIRSILSRLGVHSRLEAVAVHNETAGARRVSGL